MNRYSRIVTQPKDQGASQVSPPHLLKIAPARSMYRQCCTRQTVSTANPTFKKQWLASVVSGNPFTSLSACLLILTSAAGMRAIREHWAMVEKKKVKLIRVGNRCNKHLLGLGHIIKTSVCESEMIGYQFGTVGVSDGISNGTAAMNYSLQSRDLIADQVETAAGGHWLDGMVVVPGCDKNMPGVLMARG